MGDKTRISVSIDCDLVEEFDALLEDFGYESRSKAICDLIVDALLKKRVSMKKGKGMCVLVVVVDRRIHETTEFYHHHVKDIISTLHIHADEENCVEVSILRGDVSKIEKMAMRLKGTKGVKYASFVPLFLGDLKDD